MKNAITEMPVKRNGKVLPTGTPIELEKDEFDELEAEGVVSKGSAENSKAPDNSQTLAERIATLVAEGFKFDGLNMQKTKAALGRGFDHAKRAEVDAILATLKNPTS